MCVKHSKLFEPNAHTQPASVEDLQFKMAYNLAK